jgi:hypothetical protein
MTRGLAALKGFDETVVPEDLRELILPDGDRNGTGSAATAWL